MGPDSAKSFPGWELVPVQAPAAAVPPEPQPTATVARTDQEAMTAEAPHQPARPVGRATQEID
jgi:hypothetical protein